MRYRVWMIVLVVLGLAARSFGQEESAPERIVSLLPSLTEILFAVGAGDQVVGVTRSCTFPPEALSRTKIGGYASRSLNLEVIVDLEPDLVLGSTAIQGEALERLRQFGLWVESADIRSLEDIAGGIRRIGDLVGQSRQAGKVSEQLLRDVERIRRRVALIPPEKRPRVFYEVWNKPLMTAGRRTFISEVIELAGGINVFGDVEDEYFQVSREEVLDRDPEVILGAYNHGPSGELASASGLPGWEKIRAVREGRVYGIDGDIVSRPGPRLAEALEIVARQLHPAHFDPDG